MKRKVVLAVALVALMAVGAFAQYAPESDFQVTKAGNAVTITKYVGKGGAVSIPLTIQGSTVTIIGAQAFRNNTSITSVTIPNGVTSIGNFAFANCINITSVTIGNGVTSIGNSAFDGCAVLTNVTFAGTIPATGIHQDAFFGDLRAKYLAGSAGTYTKSGSVWTKQGATAQLATQGNPESDFEVQKSGNAISIVGYVGKATVVNIPPRIQNLPVTVIDEYSFYNNTSITSVTIPNGVTTIGNNAFDMCIALTSVTIPAGITSIGSSAFKGCVKLTSITIPNTVTKIGNVAFYGCTNLTSVTFQGTIPANGIHADAFKLTGDLRAKYLAGGAGTYTRVENTWTKK